MYQTTIATGKIHPCTFHALGLLIQERYGFAVFYVLKFSHLFTPLMPADCGDNLRKFHLFGNLFRVYAGTVLLEYVLCYMLVDNVFCTLFQIWSCV